MPSKCDLCGEKVINGVCTGCGMDYNRTSSADTAHNGSGINRKPSDDAEMFSKAMLKGTKTYRHRKKVITIVFLSALLFIIVVCILLMETSEDAKRAADRKREQALTERPRMSIPEISIPHVNIPKITVPKVDMGEDFQKALDHDIQAIIKQNGTEKE